MKKMLLFLTYLICIYTLLVLFLFFFQRSFLYYPSKEKIDLSYFTDIGPNDSGEIRNSDVAYTLQILLLDAAGETTEILMLKPDAEIKETK